jgi:hypothetical protein
MNAASAEIGGIKSLAQTGGVHPVLAGHLAAAHPAATHLPSGEHDSAGQVRIAGMIVGSSTILAGGCIVAACLWHDLAAVAFGGVGVVLGGFMSQLNAPNGLGNTIASAARSMSKPNA